MEDPGKPMEDPGRPRKTLVMATEPECVIQASRIFRPGDGLGLCKSGMLHEALADAREKVGSGPGRIMIMEALPANETEAKAVREEIKTLLDQDAEVFWLASVECALTRELGSHFKDNPAFTLVLGEPLAAAIDEHFLHLINTPDLGHLQLIPFLELQIEKALADWPETEALEVAISALRQKPFRLPPGAYQEICKKQQGTLPIPNCFDETSQLPQPMEPPLQNHALDESTRTSEENIKPFEPAPSEPSPEPQSEELSIDRRPAWMPEEIRPWVEVIREYVAWARELNPEWSLTRLAKELGMSRNTLRKYLNGQQK